MPTLKKEVDVNDYEALLTLFEAVTGISPRTVPEGSIRVIGDPGSDDPVILTAETIDLTITRRPNEHAMFSINPAERVEGQ